MNQIETIQILAVLLIIGVPASFLAGYIMGHMDNAKRHISRLENHIRQWNEFFVKSQHEGEGLK
jgi:hypothetical protein